MGNTNKYFTGLILTAAIVVFSGFFFLHGLMNSVKPTASSDEITYNMPRPRSALYNFFFGLEGREVKRTEVNPFKDKHASTTAAAGSVRKAEDAKKAAATAAAQKAAQAAQAAKVAAAQRKPQVIVNNIPKNDPSGTSADGANRSAQTPTAQVTQQERPRATTGGTEEKTNRISGAQWRSLVVGQPTKENVAKLIKAFNEKEVDAGTLYLIMNDLLQSSNSETQANGLLIAQQVPSLRSFTVVSNNYEKLDAANKATADAYLMSYMQGARLPILALALQSEDNDVVHRAAQVMVTGLQTTKPTPVSDPLARPGRGVVASSTKTSYSQFIPLFQNLEKSSDSSISGLAQNALSQLQALSNT